MHIKSIVCGQHKRTYFEVLVRGPPRPASADLQAFVPRVLEVYVSRIYGRITALAEPRATSSTARGATRTRNASRTFWRAKGVLC